MNIPKYPNGYTDFSDGVDISDSQIDQWVKECVTELESDPEKEESIRASGDTMVQVHTEDSNVYCVTVSKGYKQLHIYK